MTPPVKAHPMDLQQTVHQLRTRIRRLRAELELNSTNTNTNTNDSSSSIVEPKDLLPSGKGPAVSDNSSSSEPSSADVLKAKLMSKRGSSSNSSSS